MRRPIVGVTLGTGDRPGRHAIRDDYLRSVERAGAIPLLLAPVSPDHAARLLRQVDGILLSGGGDVDPALYGQKPHPRLGRVDRARDDFEVALARAALERDVPILAICRGQQLLNVATGGTLVQDIPSELGGAGEHDAPGGRRRRSHVVELLPQTRLRAILGRDTVAVNSFHHQAVDRLGAGLAPAGRCPEDGVVEALEAAGRRFVVAVQWHPESFWDQPVSFQPLFDAHVEACRS